MQPGPYASGGGRTAGGAKRNIPQMLKGAEARRAMRYGTPVVAHATGGLRDTVIDVNFCRAAGSEDGTGWTFDSTSSAGIASAHHSLALACTWDSSGR